jgi:L-alanine-DL-glutamate epimerase-like enolase superfamily enzyme
MKLTGLSLKKLNIPFKVSFKHTSAERSVTQSIWVTAVSNSGNVGHGEGCPREYVTNESLETAASFFETHQASIIDKVNSLESLTIWMLDHKNEIDKNPAAWCAIELALLDLLAQEDKQNIENVLGLDTISQPFQYTAVLGDSSIEVFSAQLERYITMGFSDFKIKISGNIERDNEKLTLFKKYDQQKIRLRIDANNIWKDAEAAITYIKALSFPVFAIEEPLSAGQYEALNKIASACGIKIILDESFLNADDFVKIKGPTSHWIINLRVSKMGGLLRSLLVVKQATQLGISLIVGAQVGETSLLTRAALTVSNSARDILIAQEGAFGTLLLQHDICDSPLMFKEKGVLNFTPSSPYGFQLLINSDFK